MKDTKKKSKSPVNDEQALLASIKSYNDKQTLLSSIKSYENEKRGQKLDRPVYDMNSLLELIPIGRSSIYHEIKAGRLRTCKMGRRTLFLPKDILSWLESLRSS